MKAMDLHQHFISREPWVEGDTVDGVIYGKPNLDVDRCLVAWMPGMTAEYLQQGACFHLVGMR